MIPLSNRALVVGASSGIGAATARLLARRGYAVALVARREEELKALCESINQECGHGKAMPYPADAADFEKVPALFDKIVQDLGGLDLVVYAAGVMPKIEIDEFNFAKDRSMIEVNFMAAVAWLNEVAALMNRLRGGTIIGVSSIAGDRGRKGNPVYCASKAALNTFLESLRNRLDAAGVKVVTIKPGFVDTAMTRGMPGLFWLITPEEAARRILLAAEGGFPTVYVPHRWWMIGAIIRMIPSFVFRKLNV